MRAIYNLFLRQWKRGKAVELDLQEAVGKGLITEQEKNEITEHEQNI